MTSLYHSVIFLLSVAAIQVQGGKNDLNQPESQPPTQQADSSSVRPKLPRPTRLTQKELTHHRNEEEKEEVEYSKFIECEKVADYAVTEAAYVLVLNHPGEGWIALDKYMREQDKPSVYEVRFIAREVLKALSSLKSLGVVHGDITAKNILYNERTSELKLMNFGLSGVLEKWNPDSSASGSSNDKSDFWGTEKIDLVGVGNLIYYLLTSENANQYQVTRQRVEEKLKNSLRRPDSQIGIDVMNVVPILLGRGPSKMATLEDALKHPFFTSQ
ncbi:hypothetical protein BASA50_007815 [Batrachochytrium salamandrivorans]|uniref:Protein kinase domain-containing protein n=1 Tax=Batrachochytrium salamandrivorans TaxID=1357716 RepID=A0ABQ8F5S1_9FUNG|nr:hypothetical protein BASA50_007815 [Batrachochytrium salamandrivorans]